MELKSALTDVPGKMYKNITNVVFAHNNIFFSKFKYIYKQNFAPHFRKLLA